MLAVADAQARIWAAFPPGPVEWVGIDQGLGRVLADDLVSRRDQPPDAVSAMDGYAVRAADTANVACRLRVVGEVPAGAAWEGELQSGEAVRIFTGAVIPRGADAILIQEDAAAEGEAVRPLAAVESGRFVRPRGLDFAAGWLGLATGRKLDPLALGLAAAMGHAWLPVRQRPRIGLLATGDELRWPGEMPGRGQIISSNSTALAGLVRLWGGEPVDLGICRDRPDELTRVLQSASGLDALVTTGGASVGDYDLVKQALGARGLELDFWKIAMRPGKPLIFGRLSEVPVLGFPGNPVSAAVCAIVFLRGTLHQFLGLDPTLPTSEAELTIGLGANDAREDYLRATLARRSGAHDLVTPSGRQDSSMFATLVAADALAVRPPHAAPADAGTIVPIVRLDEVFSWRSMLLKDES